MISIVDLLHNVTPCQCGVIAYGGTAYPHDANKRPRTVVRMLLDVSDLADIQTQVLPAPEGCTDELDDLFLTCAKCGTDWTHWNMLLDENLQKVMKEADHAGHR